MVAEKPSSSRSATFIGDRRGGAALKRFDVVVVGARCARTSVAPMLARRGLSVCLVDRAQFPSETPSTHIIQPCGVQVLDRLGVLDAIVGTGAVKLDRLTMVIDDAVRIESTLDSGGLPAPHAVRSAGDAGCAAGRSGWRGGRRCAHGCARHRLDYGGRSLHGGGNGRRRAGPGAVDGGRRWPPLDGCFVGRCSRVSRHVAGHKTSWGTVTLVSVGALEGSVG